MCHVTEMNGCSCRRRYYSLFTLGMLVMFECTVVMQRLRNLKELRTLSTPKQAIQARPRCYGRLTLCIKHPRLCRALYLIDPLKVASEFSEKVGVSSVGM